MKYLLVLLVLASLGLGQGRSLAAVTEDLAAGKIPLYPGAKPHPAKLGRGYQLSATLDARLTDVIGFYRSELPKRGWKATIAPDILDRDLERVPLALMLYARGKSRLRIMAARGKRRQQTIIWLGYEQ